jgi:hypothetical protein
MLQCLVVEMLHRAVAKADGNVTKAFNVSISAGEAGEQQDCWFNGIPVQCGKWQSPWVGCT